MNPITVDSYGFLFNCTMVCKVRLCLLNYKTKMNIACFSSHRCLGSLVARKKKFRLKRENSLEDINLSRQKQSYRFYLFDKSWNFSVWQVIYYSTSILNVLTQLCINLAACKKAKISIYDQLLTHLPQNYRRDASYHSKILFQSVSHGGLGLFQLLPRD